MSNTNKFFTNTYITGSGRQNYLKSDILGDPLFTSFTFDIDFITSPLFYTINNSEYGYPSASVKSIGGSIKTALEQMYKNNLSSKDDGYDIFPTMSAYFLDEYKLGFGLQKNIYMDLPLYGATEYIYMVDRRNAGSSQNDVRFNNDNSVDGGQNPTSSNSYKLGESVNGIVSESDRQWNEQRANIAAEQIKYCDNALNGNLEGDSDAFGDSDVIDGSDSFDYNNLSPYQKHRVNEYKRDSYLKEYENAKVKVEKDGKEVMLNETELQALVNEYKAKDDEFNKFKKSIVDWANGEISKYQSDVESLFSNNECIKKILKYDKLEVLDEAKKKSYYDDLKKEFGKTFVYDNLLGKDTSVLVAFNNKFNSLVTVSGACKNMYKTCKEDDKKSFLLETDIVDNLTSIRLEILKEKFKSEFIKFGLYDEKNPDEFKCKFCANQKKESPEWLTKLSKGFIDFVNSCITIAKSDDGYKEISNGTSICEDWDKMSKALMSYQCDTESSFVEFELESIKKNNEVFQKYKDALKELQIKLYGSIDGEPCGKENPTSEGIYGKYKEFEDLCKNDEYVQIIKYREIAMSELAEMNDNLNVNQNNDNGDSDGGDSDIDDVDSDDGGNNNAPLSANAQNEQNKNTSLHIAPQTVLDMLGFISGMKKMTIEYPYIIQEISGLDTAYNKHYGVKDPYLGSGEDKITLTCLESLDLRVSSMFNRYFNAVYDRQYRRERVPINLRRFNCSVFIHDVRNFVSRIRKKQYENKIIELTDMYYSVIEFRFYDCEIVPEETGNIFTNVSNASPSEMTKTNFTFTYGNCVVNFVPRS